MGETSRKTVAGRHATIARDPVAAVTPLGELPFVIGFLKVSGVFEAWVVDCLLIYPRQPHIGMAGK